MKKILFFVFVFLSSSSFSQENNLLQKVEWNGYIQLRAASNFDNYSSFSLRRMKLWVKSKPEFSEHWSYKLQSTISSLAQEKFFLQDVKVSYKTSLFSIDFGQFIPAYSLEWSQPDYTLAIIERAKAIDAITPSGSLGVRDIGMQANFETKNKLLQTSAGIFNGYGIKEYRFSNKGYMFTHKTAINISLQKNKLQFGYSLQYRNAENLKIPKVLPDSISFSGNDLRYNIFARFENKYFQLQAEYLSADFGNQQQANGWYLLSAFNIKKNQIVFSYENYNDLISTTNDNPYFHTGYNYQFNKNKIKLYLDNSFQITDNKINNTTSIQLQIFFK